MGSVRVLVSALEGVASHVETTNHDLFAGEGLLAPYLAGIYLWTSDVTETLHSLARDLNALTPDWASFRARLGDVAWIYEMAHSEGRRLEGVLDLLPVEMHEPMDELLVAFVDRLQRRSRVDVNDPTEGNNVALRRLTEIHRQATD